MSTNRNVANLSITIVKTLVKMAGFGRVADMIDGSQECLNLLADIKNDALGNPNAEMIRALNGAVKSELDAIQGALKHNGLGRKQVKRAAAQLAEAARETIKNLAEDDNALIRAVQQPQYVAEQLRGHAAPLPNLSSDEMQAHYETLLDRIAEEFLTLAPWSPNFDRVALTELLRCFPALTDQIARVEHEIQVLHDKADAESERSREADAETHRKLDDIKDIVGSSIPTEGKSLRIVFGSRPDVVAGERFVKRDAQEQLNRLISDRKRNRTVLVGMRGCGKTQLAAALAQECEDADWNLVAWVHAGSPESIKSGMVELAKELKIDTSDQPTQEQIVGRCLNYLRSSEASDRLIIFDNVEDINDLRGLVPSGDGLRVVATTTNNTGWEYQGWTTIKVGVFDRERSIKYLLTVTNSTDYDAADTLAHRLGDLPLAITQAAATARNGDLSLARYLDRLDSYGSERAIRPVPGDYYADDVATALYMAIEDALENLADPTRPYARRQLGALALLAESGVPTRWLDPTIEQLDDDESPNTQRDTDEDAHDALTELIHRSIIQQSADKATTMLHRLQAQVFRESWDEKETTEAYESSTMLLGNVNIDSFPRNDTDSRRQEVADLIEQLRIVGAQKYSQVIFSNERVRERLGDALAGATDLGFPAKALNLRDVVDYIKSILDPNHPDIFKLRNSIAHAYESAGYLSSAITTYEQLVADGKRLLGDSSETVLTLRDNLAGTYAKVGRLNDSITIYKQVLSDRTAILGADHPSTLTSYNNLAYAYQQIGRLAEAIVLLEGVVSDRKRILGPDHRDTLTSIHNLAFAYQEIGQLNTAADLFNKIIAQLVQSLGEDHPATLSARNNLAYTYQQLGLLDESVDLYKTVQNHRIRILGQDHPDTLSTCNNLAGSLLRLGRIEEAFEHYEQVLIERTRILGKDHPDTLTTRNNLAYVYQEAGLLDEATAIYKNVLADRIRILGNDHPDTLTTRNNLAYVYQEAGLLDEATAIYKNVLADRIRILGKDHPHTLTSRNNLAYAYESAGRLEEAITLYEQVLPDSIRILGEDHPNTLTSRNNLANAYSSAGRAGDAIPLYEQVLNARSCMLGEDHPRTLASRNNLAYSYLLVGRTGEAISQYEQLLKDCTDVLGPGHPLTETVRDNLEAARRELAQREDSSPTEESAQEY